MKDELSILSNIQEVNAPEFLYTRILERIERKRNDRIPAPLGWAIGLGFVIIMALNIVVFLHKFNEQKVESNLVLVSEFLPKNGIYE